MIGGRMIRGLELSDFSAGGASCPEAGRRFWSSVPQAAAGLPGEDGALSPHVVDLGRSAALVRIWRGGIDDNGTAELLRHQQLPVQDVAAVPTYRSTYLPNQLTD